MPSSFLTRSPRRAATPLPSPEEDDAQPAVGTTGGLTVQQAGTWDKPPAGPLPDDPAQRRTASIASANADFAEQQRQTNPFIFSNDIKTLAQAGGRQYEEAAVRGGEQAYQQQVVRQRQQAAQDTAAFNSKALAGFKAKGQQYYEDPATKRLTPVIDESGRSLYHETPWEVTNHPKTGTPVMGKRDRYGQQQFKELPVVPGEDPTDPQMYYRTPDGDISPAGNIEDLLAHPSYNVRRQALAANTRRSRAVIQQTLAPLKELSEVSQSEFQNAQNDRDALQAQIQQANQLAEESVGNDAQSQGYRATAAQLQTKLDGLNTALNPKGDLYMRRNAATRDYAIARRNSVLGVYKAQEMELAARLKAEGKDPTADPTFQANQHMIQQIESQQMPQAAVPQAGQAPQQQQSFDTKLAPQDEASFQQWKQQAAPTDSGADYDFRGAFKAGVQPDANGHWPDTFKKPNHPTFSNESQYASAAPDKAGSWNGDTFVPPAKAAPLEQSIEPYAMAQRGERSIGGVDLQQMAQRFGGGQGEVNPSSLLAVGNRIREIDETLNHPDTKVSGKLRQSLQAQRDYLGNLYDQRFARLPEDQQGRVKEANDTAAKDSAKGTLRRFFEQAHEEGSAPEIGAGGTTGKLATIPRLPDIGGYGFGQPGEVATGLVNSLSKTVSGLTSKENLALLIGTAGAGKVVQRLISGGFGAAMLNDARKQAPEVWKKLNDPNISASEKSEAVGDFVSNLLLGTVAAKHALKGAPAGTKLTPKQAEAAFQELLKKAPKQAAEPPKTTETVINEQAAPLSGRSAEDSAGIFERNAPQVDERQSSGNARESAAAIIEQEARQQAQQTAAAGEVPLDQAGTPAELAAVADARSTARAERVAQEQAGGPPAEQSEPTGRTPEQLTQDRQAYDSIQAQMKALTDAHGMDAVNSPEYQRLWAMSETVKNRNGGYVPEPEKTAEAPATAERTAEPEQAAAVPEQSAPAAEPVPQPRAAAPEPTVAEPRPATSELRRNNADLGKKPVAQLSRAEKRAELDEAGITHYNGVPLDDINPAQLSSALGKLRSGDLTKETQLTTDKINAALDKAKFHKPGDIATATPATLAWDTAIDLAKLGVRAGRPIEQVIRNAIDHYKARNAEATEEDLSKLERTLRESTGAEKPSLMDRASEAWRKASDVSSLKDAISAHRDAVENMAGTKAAEARNEVSKALDRAEPDKAGRKVADDALRFYIEASDGKPAELAKMRATLEASTKADPKWKIAALKAIDYAEKNGDKLKDAANRYRRLTGDLVTAETEAGLPIVERKNYVPRYQDVEEAGMFDSKGGNSTGGQNRKVRTFDTMADSIAAGIDPKSLSSTDSLSSRMRAGMTGANLRLWQQSLMDTKTADGDALAAKPERIERKDGTFYYEPPKGYKLETIGNSPIAVKQEYSGLIGALTDPSWLSKNKVTLAAQKANALAKSMTLAVDTFHLGRLAFRDAMINASHPTGFKLGSRYREGLLTSDSSPAEIKAMGERGEIPKDKVPEYLENKKTLDGLIKEGYNTGQISDAMHQEMVQKLPLLGSVNKFIFQQFQRGAMADAGVLEFKRQKADNPGMTDQQVARKVAKELNTRFGSLGRQGLFKSATARDLMRMIFLAPQWNEGLIRSELGGIKDLGQFAANKAMGRKASVGLLGREMATTAVSLFVASQILNQATRGKFTWENPEESAGAKMSAWIPDKIGSSAGFFLNPMGLTAETGHLLMNSYERNGNTHQPLVDYLRSRESVGAKIADTFITGKDALGRDIKPADRWKETGKAAIPAPISGGSAVRVAKGLATGGKTEEFPGEFQKQAMQTFGLRTDRAPTPENRIQGLASDFLEGKGKEKGAATEVSDFAGLTAALRRANPDDVKSEIHDLLGKRSADDLEKYYKQWMNHSFAGSHKLEQDFLRTLNPEQRQQYGKARAERKRIGEQALRAIHQIPTAERAGPFKQPK